MVVQRIGVGNLKASGQYQFRTLVAQEHSSPVSRQKFEEAHLYIDSEPASYTDADFTRMVFA